MKISAPFTTLLAPMYFALCSCGGDDPELEAEFIDSLGTILRDQSASRFDLATVTTFDWDAVHVFRPYTKQATIRAAIGFRIDDRLIHQRDDINLFVFTKNGDARLTVAVPRGICDAELPASDSSAQSWRVAVREASFEVHIDDTGYCRMKPVRTIGRRNAMLRHIAPGIHLVVEQAGLDNVVDNTDYWRRRTQVERAYYRDAWLAAKCHDLPQGVLASFTAGGDTSAFPVDPRLPPRIYNVSSTAHDPLPGEEGWWWAEQAWEAYLLMSRAYAVDRRTAQRFGPIHYEYSDVARGSWQNQDPLLAEIVQLKRWGHPVEREETRRHRLVHAYLATIYAAAQGLTLDRKWLAAQIGPPISDEEWDEAVRRSEPLLRAQGRRVLLADQPPKDG